jgi:hypothetical protein
MAEDEVKPAPEAVTTDAEIITPDPEDEESDVDGCEVDFRDEATPDEELPATEGGVA